MGARIIAAKDLRLLLRDRRTAMILLLMPLLFILILSIALGESFGQKPDDRLRISVVVEDVGPEPGDNPPDGQAQRWSDVVLRDLQQTAGVRVEWIPDRATGERMVRRGERAAVLVFGPEFSHRIGKCSFMDDRFLKQPGLNPFFRDGIDLAALDVLVLRDPTQSAAAAIIAQVAQVAHLRVVLPWMIGRAFDEVARKLPAAAVLLPQLFANYDLTAKTWAKLTKSPDVGHASSATDEYRDAPSGILARGSMRYQVLVPSYIVTFAFALVLTCGWLFVAERRQGTLTRLRAAPLTISQIYLGKMTACFAVSVFQGLFLLGAGKLIFGMSWGTQPWWLPIVVLTTSFAATGLAMCVGAIARNESQVAVYGTLLMLVLAGVSGSLMPRDLMPETMRQWSRATPHAWALDAYSQLLMNPQPEIGVVVNSCLVLLLFGIVYALAGWWFANFDHS